MFSPVMKVGFLWTILGAQCGSHPEPHGQQESEGILELGKHDLDLFFEVQKF
jgi:hypothetical protein